MTRSCGGCSCLEPMERSSGQADQVEGGSSRGCSSWPWWSYCHEQYRRHESRTSCSGCRPQFGRQTCDRRCQAGCPECRRGKLLRAILTAKVIKEVSGKAITVDAEWDSFIAGPSGSISLWLLTACDGAFILGAIAET